MRTLEDLRVEILENYHDLGIKLSHAIERAAPFDDIAPQDLEIIVRAGLSHLIGHDNEWLRSHPVADKATKERRSYLGRFQLRPEREATAQFAYEYPNLTVRFYVGRVNKQVLDFEEEDTYYMVETERRREEGVRRRRQYFEWLRDRFAEQEGKVRNWPPELLREANERAGVAFA